jgi:hypothetical protein
VRAILPSRPSAPCRTMASSSGGRSAGASLCPSPGRCAARQCTNKTQWVSRGETHSCTGITRCTSAPARPLPRSWNRSAGAGGTPLAPSRVRCIQLRLS